MSERAAFEWLRQAATRPEGRIEPREDWQARRFAGVCKRFAEGAIEFDRGQVQVLLQAIQDSESENADLREQLFAHHSMAATPPLRTPAEWSGSGVAE